MIFVYVVVGGVGFLMVQWVSSIGVIVIGCVFIEEKVMNVKVDGVYYVILYFDKNFVERVKEIINGVGVLVVYDLVGKDIFQVNLLVVRKIICSI